MSTSPRKPNHNKDDPLLLHLRHGSRESPGPSSKDADEHFLVSPTGEIIKVKTPEKIKIKRASVVLEKLADDEILCGSSYNGKIIRSPRGKKIPVPHSAKSEKSFPYTVEYRIESCTGREKHSESTSPTRKVKTNFNELTNGTSRERVGHLYKSSDRSRSDKFINAFSNETFSGNVKPNPSVSKSSMTIKHENSFYISSFVSREKMKSSVSQDLESHSIEKKPKQSFITDVVTTSQRHSSSAKTENTIHSKTSPQKDKPKYIQTNLSLIKFSDVKQHTEPSEQDKKPALQKLAVVGSTTKSEEARASPLKEARAQFATRLSNVSSGPVEIPPLDLDVMRVNRCKVTPVILSHNKSKITTHSNGQLLDNKNTPCGKDKLLFNSSSKREVIKEKQPVQAIPLQRSIPGKGTSVSLNVVGRTDESDIDLLDTNSPTKTNEKPLTRRYKNTRYSLPYRSPSIVVPKNYSVSDNSTKSRYEATMSGTQLPEMKHNTSDLLRRRYNKTGRITTVPILPKTTESLVMVSPGIHTMETTKDLLNVKSIQVVEKPTSDKMENVSIGQKLLSPRKSMSTSPNKLRGSCTEEHLSMSISSPFYSIKSSKRFCELMSEANHLDSPMTALEYTSLMNYQQSPLKNVHQRFSRNKVETGSHRTCCTAVVPQVTKESMPNNNAHANADENSSSVGPVPRNSPFAQSPVLPEKDCSGCFYCEFEQMMKKIEGHDKHDDNIPLTEDFDHAYTKANSSEMVMTKNSEVIEEPTHSEYVTNTYETSHTTQTNIPLYAFNVGDNIILMPYSNSLQTSSKSLPELEKKEKVEENGCQKIREVGRKKKRQRKIRTPKRNNFKNMCKNQLRFKKILRLHPKKEKSKTSMCDDNGISEVLRELGFGKSVQSKVFVPLLQIDRDINDVFTHISTTACMTVTNGSDAMLKRWNDFDDYPIRLSKDTISGAITDIEVDAVPQGLYTITTTGESLCDGVCKNMAILSSVIPNTTTVLDNSTLLAVGPVSNLSKTNFEQPATIQKHRNMNYLLSSVLNLLNQPIQDSVVSERDYRPKCDSPGWYRAPRFDVFTRLYHRQKSVTTPMEKLTGKLFTCL